MYSVVDLGGATPPPLFWVKNEEITEGRKAGRASKTTPPPSTPLAQGLDLPLCTPHNQKNLRLITGHMVVTLHRIKIK